MQKHLLSKNQPLSKTIRGLNFIFGTHTLQPDRKEMIIGFLKLFFGFLYFGNFLCYFLNICLISIHNTNCRKTKWNTAKSYYHFLLQYSSSQHAKLQHIQAFHSWVILFFNYDSLYKKVFLRKTKRNISIHCNTYTHSVMYYKSRYNNANYWK